MESSLVLLGLLGAVSIAYALIIGLLLMVIANLCHVIQNKYSDILSVIFASLSSAAFVLVLTKVFPNPVDSWYVVPIVLFSSYVVFLYYIRDASRHGLLGLFIITSAVFTSLYLNDVPLLASAGLAMAFYFVSIAVSLVIGVASCIFSAKSVKYTVRFFGFLFYFFLVYAFVRLFV